MRHGERWERRRGEVKVRKGGGTGVLGGHGARTSWGGGGTAVQGGTGWPCQCSGGKEGWHGRA